MWGCQMPDYPRLCKRAQSSVSLSWFLGSQPDVWEPASPVLGGVWGSEVLREKSSV